MRNDFIGAESAVAGAILIDADCLPAVLALLQPEDFALEPTRAIFTAARDLDREGERADAVTIEARLAKDGAPLTREYLMQLMETTPTAANVEGYAAIVREASQRRRLRTLGESIVERAQAAENPAEIIGDAARLLEQLEEQDAGDILSSKDAVFQFYRYRDALEKGGGVAVPTGLTGLDRLLGGGFLDGGLYLAAARPGVGKTTVALTIADNVAQDVGPVLFVSLEMSDEQLTAKRISRCTALSSTDLLTRGMDDGKYKAVAAAGEYLCKLPLYLNRRPRCTVSDIRALARKVKGLRFVVVDYLGLIQPEERTPSRYEAVTRISGDLKALARTLGVPVLALCQLNRANEARADKRPSLADLRDSGSLEQDADGVILLHRKDYYEDEDSGAAVPIELHLAKNRHAGVGKMELAFDKRTSSFVEFENRA